MTLITILTEISIEKRLRIRRSIPMLLIITDIIVRYCITSIFFLGTQYSVNCTVPDQGYILAIKWVSFIYLQMFNRICYTHTMHVQHGYRPRARAHQWMDA